MLMYILIIASNFEVSQRLKGLGPEFSHIIDDTITDIINYPSLLTTLPQSLLYIETQSRGDYIPIYRIGYFSPHIFKNLSSSIFLEGQVDYLSYRKNSDMRSNFWLRNLFNLSYPLNKKFILSIGSEIFLLRSASFYQDIWAGNYEEKINDYTFVVSFTKLNKHPVIFGNIKYESGKGFYSSLSEEWWHTEDFNYYFWGDTLIFQRIIIDGIYERSSKGENNSKFIRTNIGMNPVFGDKRKIKIFISLNFGNENSNSTSYESIYGDSIIIIKKIYQDTSSEESDTHHYKTSDTSIYRISQRILDIGFGIGEARKIANMKMFYGIRYSYYFSRGGIPSHKLFIPIGLEYKISNSFSIRMGITPSIYIEATFYNTPMFEITQISNKYYLGLGFFPIKGWKLDTSVRGEWTNINNWEFSVIKEFM